MRDTEVGSRGSSNAGRRLAQARWGTTRLDRLISELSERRDELGVAQREHLVRVLNGRGDARV